MIAYGSKQSTLFARDLPEGSVVEPGKIYHAEYKVEGIQTLFPGWENAAVDRMNSAILQQGCEPVYLDVDSENQTITMQFRRMDQARATFFGVDDIIVVYAVCIIAITAAVVIGAWLLSVTMVGAAKELSTVISDNPMMTPIIYGGVALALIVALIYLKNQFSPSDA